MHLLTTNLLPWLLAAGCCVGVGYALMTGANKKIFFALGVVGGIAAVVLGIVFVFFVQTDEKQIRRTLEEIKTAVVDGDVDRALEFVEQDAKQIRAVADAYLSRVRVDKAKISNFRIEEINRLASPPRARVAFRVGASGDTSGEWGGAFTTLVDFDLVELRLDPDGVWRVTNAVQFQPARGF